MINKKILEVCFSPDLGGLELYMSKCTNELSKNFDICCVVSINSKLKTFFNDIKTFEIKRESTFSLIASFKLAKIIDNEKIDIVHLHWTKDIPIVVLAKKISKRDPKIVQTRHMTMTRFKDDFYHKFLYKNIDTIICVTKGLEEQIHKFIPQDIRPKTKLLYLGAANCKSLNSEEIEELKEQLNVNNSFMIGLVGRINEFKGQYLLIEAMKILKNKGLNLKSYIVGNAMSQDYLSELKSLVSKYNLEDNITFVGFTDEPGKFMQACDVVLMTSRKETFGLVTIEAMKNRTAVIASAEGGVLEIIDDEENGLLFESGNYVDLSVKIEKLYSNCDLKELIVEHAKEKVDNFFDSAKQFEKLNNFFKTI